MSNEFLEYQYHYGCWVRRVYPGAISSFYHLYEFVYIQCYRWAETYCCCDSFHKSIPYLFSNGWQNAAIDTSASNLWLRTSRREYIKRADVNITNNKPENMTTLHNPGTGDQEDINFPSIHPVLCCFGSYEKKKWYTLNRFLVKLECVRCRLFRHR